MYEIVKSKNKVLGFYQLYIYYISKEVAQIKSPYRIHDSCPPK